LNILYIIIIAFNESNERFQMCLEANVLAVLAAQHRENSGLSREEAELQYIREAVLLEAPLNAHLYRLRRSKNEAGPGRILLAICARGVRIYTEEETPRIFAWNNIGKLSFDVSAFGIEAPIHALQCNIELR